MPWLRVLFIREVTLMRSYFLFGIVVLIILAVLGYLIIPALVARKTKAQQEEMANLKRRNQQLTRRVEFAEATIDTMRQDALDSQEVAPTFAATILDSVKGYYRNAESKEVGR